MYINFWISTLQKLADFVQSNKTGRKITITLKKFQNIAKNEKIKGHPKENRSWTEIILIKWIVLNEKKKIMIVECIKLKIEKSAIKFKVYFRILIKNNALFNVC